MPLPEINRFIETLQAAIAQATSIASRAKTYTNLYLNDEIDAWARAFCTSRFFSSKPENIGYFDKAEFAVLEYLKARFPSYSIPEMPMTRFQGEASGTSFDSQAVFNQIGRINERFNSARVTDLYTQFDGFVTQGMPTGAFQIYDTLFCGVELELSVLYNTMMNKMNKGPKPMPSTIAGPGQKVVRTAMGDIVVDEQSKKIGELTVEEYIVLEQSILVAAIRKVLAEK